MHDAPGPWTRENRRGRAIIIDADRNEVCEAFVAPALIAAAPDLLAALREIVAEWDTQHADEDHRTGYTLDTGGIAQARAAIARATGADHA